MWTLEQIHANNFSAFKELDFTLLQGHATLIFGNNMDNDSQKSNGSGKSALIEAIAVGLTGATLRNIKTEEIINDSAEEATVSLLLSNNFSGEHLSITRTLSRKNPQVIEVLLSERMNEDGDFDWKPVSQSSVADYNKCILDMLGLTRDDIYSNYILCKHKYQSFLSSSDREKKEIINRFSNGILVDESIAALQADMEPIIQEMKDAERDVANKTGRVSAIQEQIENAQKDALEKSESKTKRIDDLNGKIADKRAAIREAKSKKADAQNRLGILDTVEEKLNDLEGSQPSLEQAQKAINELFLQNQLKAVDDFESQIIENREKLKRLKEKEERTTKNLEEYKKLMDEKMEEYKKCEKSYELFLETYDSTTNKLKQELRKLDESIRELVKLNDELMRKRRNANNLIARLENQLSGVIQCPKCKHEFTLTGDLNIDEVRKQKSDAEQEIIDLGKSINDNEDKMDLETISEREKKNSLAEQDQRKNELSQAMADAKVKVSSFQSILIDADADLKQTSSSIVSIQKDIDDTVKALFDQAFDILDSAIKIEEKTLDACDVEINNAEGVIQSHLETIQEIKTSSDTDVISNLKLSKEKYEVELKDAVSHKGDTESKLNKYRIQEATFVEFKTHLANSKIEALSHITNEFLEAIGSDIRIAFSGFTVLKSGKIRDKISISLLRDGVNCGSFDKFSEGEKARVNLANILAMHKLTNTSCQDGKGLDLLVLDEILDATDETGLSNIFESLNAFQITSLVVSHGNIAENYPYKLIVNKQNGVSFI